jgi:transcriptional regulator with XRE-family HTH domain
MTAAELRTIRRALRWTQATAAERLGVHARTYKYYEAGETSAGTRPSQIPQAVALAMLYLRCLAKTENERAPSK